MWNLPGPGIEQCPLHWQVDSYPLLSPGIKNLTFKQPYGWEPHFVGETTDKSKLCEILNRIQFIIIDNDNVANRQDNAQIPALLD